MVSARANALDEDIRTQDCLLLRARARQADPRFVEAAIQVRNQLVRDLVAEWSHTAAKPIGGAA